MDTEIIHIIENAYGIEPVCLSQTRDGITFYSKSSPGNKYILKPCPDSPERRIFIYAVHKHLNTNGFKYTDSILRTYSGGIFTELGGRLFTCSRLPVGRQCAIENDTDLKGSAALLAHMHNSAEGFTQDKAEEIINSILPCSCASINACERGFIPDRSDRSDYKGTARADMKAEMFVKNELGTMPELYRHRCSELRRFQRLASKGRGRFDYEYMHAASHYCNVAADMCDALASSAYSSISDMYEEKGTVCHRDYTSHNIFFHQSSTPADECSGEITGFDCAVIDIPILDITNLIKRRMRKCGWHTHDADLIINSYSRIRVITREETEIMKIVLRFPQKLWRIVNKYYNSRRSWCEKSCLMKLGEIKQESAQIEEFIKSF